MELLAVLAFFGYLYYLRNHADLRSEFEKEGDHIQEGIQLYQAGHTDEALSFFSQRIITKPNSSLSYLYRGLCYRELGDEKSALNDLNTGLGYDGTNFTLHLEKGKLLFVAKRYASALESFEKAVFNAGEQSPECYHWRGLTKQHLNRQEEAGADFEKELSIRDAIKSNGGKVKSQKRPFVDRHLIGSAVLVTATSAVLVVVIKEADSIHLPYLLATLSAILIGFVEPQKGWALAILQSIMVLAGYKLLADVPGNGGEAELENFSLYGSVILCFAGSFLGGFLKRAISQG